MLSTEKFFLKKSFSHKTSVAASPATWTSSSLLGESLPVFNLHFFRGL